MPKEITYSNDPEFFIDATGAELGVHDHPPGEEHAYYRRGVHVGWTRNGTVEIGVAQFEITRERHTEGHFTSLNRDGINRLIRSLRKARDQAFGPDA